jgi:DNA-binding response OmpR family regulator
MPNETILLVDDIPANLRLTAIALRSEGFRVLLASSAEQAMTMLQTLRPDALLVDIQLPGINGLELAHTVKQDPRTKDMVVVALTAFGSRDYELSAAAVGCDGFLTKPIDTRAIGERIRRCLYNNRHPRQSSEPPAPGVNAPPQGSPCLDGLGPDVDSLRHTFLTGGIRKCRLMLASLEHGLDRNQANMLADQWIGAAIALGYAGISSKALFLKDAIQTAQYDRYQVRDALLNLGSAFAEPPESVEPVLPESVAARLASRKVALIGFADDEADRLCNALDRVRASARLFPADEPLDSQGVAVCDVVVLHVRPETVKSQWLSEEWIAQCEQAVVLVGSREHLLTFDPSSHFWGCESLIDGWQPEEAAIRLTVALARVEKLRNDFTPAVKRAHPSRPREVLIADQDMAARFLLQAAFEQYGMHCRIAETGGEALRIIRDEAPHAAVLDVSIPEMDGFQVVEQVRAEHRPVRILLLSGKQSRDDALRGFSLGADDYVAKPFSAQEVVARLRRLL